MDNELKARWIAASRQQRAAYFAWQNASGDQVIPALDAYRKASLRQREIEAQIDDERTISAAMAEAVADRAD
jgi:hypothetical protein